MFLSRNLYRVKRFIESMNIPLSCFFMVDFIRLIGPVGRVFANDPGDLGSVPGRVIPKWYLIPPSFTLSNMRYVSRVKWSNPGKGVALSPTPRCSSYWKGSLLVVLDYGRRLYLHTYRIVERMGYRHMSTHTRTHTHTLYIYIYIYIYTCLVEDRGLFVFQSFYE